ncbi:hypothetical protein [Pandoraea pulmonicola]|uniref:Uncharacterized protein n=1 Tax=Pandoraea pulmonicola TaxID=93221 RepID=A0AAJ5CZY6_PANPU|nr:hypothetical protein [Pandoraea pulmonicola]AJC21220.1 hypothetical protein RO07_13340 [Pandoraea pulmonicola]SUA90098.1 Uncharacterised protein [Pandoraea pulmonicola]
MSTGKREDRSSELMRGTRSLVELVNARQWRTSMEVEKEVRSLLDRIIVRGEALSDAEIAALAQVRRTYATLLRELTRQSDRVAAHLESMQGSKAGWIAYGVIGELEERNKG